MGPSGHFRGSKIQKSGKCHGLPRKSIFFFNPHPTLQLGVLGLKISKSLGNVMELPRKWFHFKPLTPTHPGGAVLWGHRERGREEEGRSKGYGRGDGGRRDEGRREGGGEAVGRTMV